MSEEIKDYDLLECNIENPPKPTKRNSNIVIVTNDKNTASRGRVIPPKPPRPPIPEHLKIIPLGGLDEIGMNITVFEYKDSLIIVDCGVSFTDENEPGVDYIVPDVSYILKNQKKVKALFITHGHEDHIGAIPYLLSKIDIPIYATKLTSELIKVKLNKYHMEDKGVNVVQFDDVIEAGEFKVEFIKTNHSIQDSAAFAIYTPEGIIIHTGDFKIDHTPVYGDPINLSRFANLGNEGVLAMLCDSTNAERAGSTMPEIMVGRKLDSLFKKYKDRRILISTFASNVDRVHQIIDYSISTGRKIVIDGTSMNTLMNVAREFGYINVPDHAFIDMSELNNYPSNKVTIIMTGSQGEPMAALTRYANKTHAILSPNHGDVVIFSAHPIPGNEKAVRKVITTLVEEGVEVVHDDVHVSGHACADDIKLLYSLVKPKYAIPIHGDIVQRQAQGDIVSELGYDSEHIKIIGTGDELRFHNNSLISNDIPLPVNRNRRPVALPKVKSGFVMLDSDNFSEIKSTTISARKQMGNDGVIIVSVTYMEGYDKVLLTGPDINYVGFSYMHYGEDKREKIQDAAENIVKLFNESKYRNFEVLKKIIKDDLKEVVWTELKSKPMIVPIISLVP